VIFYFGPVYFNFWSVRPTIFAAPSRTSCVPASYRLAIDIGHYRTASGATSATGATEFDYNRALAHRVLAALRNAGFSAAFLIGDSGATLQLEERTRQAALGRAALFVSLHHDSVQPAYLLDWMVDGRPQRYSDRFHGFSLFVSERNPDPQDSRGFAALLGDALLQQGLTPSQHHGEHIAGEGHLLLDPVRGIYRYDALAVLRTATMAAVLLETAVIVNRAEEQRVRNGEYHAKVAAALVKAVSEYCQQHPPDP
jgi:N-acetylmuramoyl-L-alanine amidase